MPIGNTKWKENERKKIIRGEERNLAIHLLRFTRLLKN
jgi:hypothetical protein